MLNEAEANGRVDLLGGVSGGVDMDMEGGGMHVARHLLLATLRGPAHSCYSVALSGLLCLSLSSSNSNPTPSSLSLPAFVSSIYHVQLILYILGL